MPQDAWGQVGEERTRISSGRVPREATCLHHVSDVRPRAPLARQSVVGYQLLRGRAPAFVFKPFVHHEVAGRRGAPQAAGYMGSPHVDLWMHTGGVTVRR